MAKIKSTGMYITFVKSKYSEYYTVTIAFTENNDYFLTGVLYFTFAIIFANFRKTFIITEVRFFWFTFEFWNSDCFQFCETQISGNKLFSQGLNAWQVDVRLEHKKR